MAEISVIVPVYKVEDYLRRCVDSILAQKFSNFELILVNDGSPDNCPLICVEYAKKDSRVIVINQKNGGLSAARNAGLDWVKKHSDSKWISFIDSDDWVHPLYLEYLYRAVKETNLMVGICFFEKTAKEHLFLDIDYFIINQDSEKFYIYHHVESTVAWGKLYARNLFDELRYPVGKKYEDGYLSCQLLFAQLKVAVVPKILYFYFENQDGIMKEEWSVKNFDGIDSWFIHLKVLKQYHLDAAIRYAYRRVLYDVAENLLKAKKKLSLLEYIRKSLLYRSKIGMIVIKYGTRFNIDRQEKEYIFSMYHGRIFRVYWILKKHFN